MNTRQVSSPSIVTDDCPRSSPIGQKPTSQLIYGAMGLGGNWDRSELTEVDIALGFAALDAAVDAGIIDIDLADIYTCSKSESVVGQWLAADPTRRSVVRLQTKAGIRLPGNTAPTGAPVHYRLDERTVREGLEGSLSRLGVDSVDRFLVHRWDPLSDSQRVAAVLDRLVDEGLTRSVGVSNVSWQRLSVLQRFMHHRLDALQMQLSLGHRGAVESQIMWNQPQQSAYACADDLLDRCQEAGVEVQAWGPLDQGRYVRDNPDPLDAATAECVSRIAAELSTSPEAVALAWVMRLPQCIRPVIGTTDPARITACAQAVETVKYLSHEHWYQLLNTARGNNVP